MGNPGGRRAFGPGHVLPHPNGAPEGAIAGADITEADGSRWIPAFSFPPRRRTYSAAGVPTDYWSTFTFPSTATVPTTTLVLNTLRAAPYYVAVASWYVGIGVYRTTSVATAVERLGVYTNEDYLPKQLIVDCGITTADTTAGLKTIGMPHATGQIPFWLPVGWVWTAVVPQVVNGNSYICGNSNAGAYAAYPVAGVALGAAATPVTAYSGATGVTGALPAMFGTPTEKQQSPLIHLARG